jgi:hypothetical protein
MQIGAETKGFVLEVAPAAAAALGYVEAGIDWSRVLANRRWWLKSSPWPYFFADNIFTQEFLSQLEAQFLEILGRGFGQSSDRTRFGRNMPNSDAYSWNLPPNVSGPLAIFYSRAWHNMLVALTGVSSTRDVNAALHHHQVASANGSVHRDVGIGWFSDQPRADGINPMDLTRCSYTSGAVEEDGTAAREVVRSLTMIIFLCNPHWQSGEGGETGLYNYPSDSVEKPAVRIAPVSNSILIFENRPDSYHSFLSNPRVTRNSIILWLHRPKSEAVSRWGDHNIYRWKAR